LFEAADGTDPELESADVDRAALIEFLRQGIARHRSAALAAATQTRAASIVRRMAIEPRLSPFEGAWQVVNPTESTFALDSRWGRTRAWISRRVRLSSITIHVTRSRSMWKLER
jgi:hypothetical protein